TVTAVVCVIVFVLWRKALQLIRPNGPQDSSLHALVLGVLGGLSMPAVTQPSMPVLAGILLGILAGVIGRTHRLRIHPVAAVVVILWLLPVVLIPWDTTFLDRRGFDVVPAVLKPRFAVRGDLHDYAPRSDRAWWDHHSDPFPALRRPETHAMFLRNQQAMALSRPLLVEALSTGKLPRMGELILGAVPGPM